MTRSPTGSRIRRTRSPLSFRQIETRVTRNSRVAAREVRQDWRRRREVAERSSQLMSMNNFKYTMVPIMSHDFFWITFAGEVSIDRLVKAHEAFTSQPEYKPGIDELLDFTASSIAEMTTEDIELIRQYRVGQPGRHNSRSVIVMNTQVEFGLGRMMGGSIAQAVSRMVDTETEQFMTVNI